MTAENPHTDRFQIFNHDNGEVAHVTMSEATHRISMDRSWSRDPPPPRDWQREVPKYKVLRDIEPVTVERMRSESPWQQCSDPNLWQYGTRSVKAGEIIECKEWPHESFAPLNYAAKKVHEFFTTRQRSRMNRSPWIEGRVLLDDGMTFSNVSVAALRPAPPMVEVRL
jgi:hypothetical protein